MVVDRFSDEIVKNPKLNDHFGVREAKKREVFAAIVARKAEVISA